jgi:alpha-tubulin suppressor-like RCC1 family protein
VSFRYGAGINKPGFNPLAAQTSTTTYYPYLYSWGENGAGALGLSNLTNYSSPKQVGSLTNWQKVSGLAASFSIKDDGTLWAWGNNNAGRLGLGNTVNRSSPTQVGALTNWKIVSSGIVGNTSAVKTDGTLWSWGYNNFGSSGLGNTTTYSSPKQVGALNNWSVVSCNSSDGNAYAIKTDGTFWSWGDNKYGQLGLGNITNYSSPKQVGALTNWLNVAAGSYCVLAVKTDGTLWTWGAGFDGRLGTGNTTSRSSPVQIGALTNWTYINAGWDASSMAIKTDGTLWGWGKNDGGQLGLGNTTAYSSPKQVGALNTWATISGAPQSSFATKTDGTLWAWGDNSSGRLGLGNTTGYSSPMQVGALNTWLSVSAGNNFTLALLY